MKKIIIIMLISAIICLLMGCNTKDTKSETAENELSDTIVIYFSATGHTKQIAETISDELHCGIYEIMPNEEYTEEDLDWKNKNSRCSREHENKKILPEIGNLLPELSVYNTIIIGYPIWFGEAPNIMYSYLKKNGEFPKGITIIPFCSSRSSSMGYSAKNLFKDIKNIKLKEGKRFSQDTTKEEITEWIRSLDL